MGVKTKLDEIKRAIKRGEKELEKLVRKEKKSRDIWTKAYHVFIRAGEILAGLKVHGTKKEMSLREIILGWRTRTDGLTKKRDDLRTQIRGAEAKLQEQRIAMAQFVEQAAGLTRATDEIVKQVFAYNDAVVQAGLAREGYLTAHVFSRLIDDQGNLRSQITFDSSDGLRRVVAMVNTMTIVRADLAGQAMERIQRFFDRFQQNAQMDATTQALYDLTKKLLVEKTSFKVGPDLYRFLAVEFDSATLPELAMAQRLLRESIRSEKTSSYIRLYERANRASKWAPVKQI